MISLFLENDELKTSKNTLLKCSSDVHGRPAHTAQSERSPPPVPSTGPDPLHPRRHVPAMWTRDMGLDPQAQRRMHRSPRLLQVCGTIMGKVSSTVLRAEIMLQELLVFEVLVLYSDPFMRKRNISGKTWVDIMDRLFISIGNERDTGDLLPPLDVNLCNCGSETAH